MRDEDRRTYGLVWTALGWAAAALQQIDRIPGTWEQYMASIRPPADGSGFFRRETPESRRPREHFWADVHFLMISVTHLYEALKRVRGGPRLKKAIRRKATEMRHLVEHWPMAETGRHAWKGFWERHGEGAWPQQVMFTPPDELVIGPQALSLTELADDVRRVERELADLELKLG